MIITTNRAKKVRGETEDMGCAGDRNDFQGKSLGSRRQVSWTRKAGRVDSEKLQRQVFEATMTHQGSQKWV